MNKFTAYILVSACITAGTAHAGITDTMQSCAQKAVSWSAIAATSIRATIPSWGSLTVLGAGIAIGCKAKDLIADKRRLLRYAALFAGGVATGALITRWPKIFWTSVKVTVPITFPIGLGYLACANAMHRIGI